MKSKFAACLLVACLVLVGCPASTTTLLSVTPNVLAAGSPDTQITLSGINFAPPVTAVLVEGSLNPLPTTFVNSQQLLAVIPSSLLSVSRTASIFAAQGTGQNQTATASLTITIGNSNPTLTSGTPLHATVGAPALTVTLTGTNFNTSSVVDFNATALSTTFVSSTQVSATIPSTLLSTAGTDKLTVVNGGTGGGTSASLNFIVLAQLAITTTSLPGGTIGVSYTSTVAASGGQTPYTWSIVSGTLPAGLTLSSSGVISGTPTAPGSSSFTLQVVDSSGNLALKVIK